MRLTNYLTRLLENSILITFEVENNKVDTRDNSKIIRNLAKLTIYQIYLNSES